MSNIMDRIDLLLMSIIEKMKKLKYKKWIYKKIKKIIIIEYMKKRRNKIEI